MNHTAPIPVLPESEGPAERAFLARVGDRVRVTRTRRGISRRALSLASGVSQRYLAQLEGGEGNISIALLNRIARALDHRIEWLVGDDQRPEGEALRLATLFSAASDAQRRRALEALEGGRRDDRGRRIALIGLRGAGKSTLGRRAALQLGLKFVELNAEIEAVADMPVTELMALYGQEGYRRLERQALDRLAGSDDSLMLAVAGGIVEEPETFDLLLSRFHTIWLKARPEEHMARVRNQGDVRPMANNPSAMDELKSILTRREALYARSLEHVDTSGRTAPESLDDLLAVIEQGGYVREIDAK